MADTRKQQNFLQGTAILALATALVKVIGAVYKIPLNAIIGEKGFGYFSTAYEIYNVLLMISTAGLPVAMSRMISQANSLDNYNQVRRVYATARGIFLGLGIVGSLLMTIFCRQLAQFQNQPDAWAAIGFLGPCVLLICLGCFLQFVLLAARMQALFYKLIAFGLAMVYAVQVFLTVGGVTKFIPSTGVTLPFVSYGGSSVLSTFIIFGVIQGLYILKRNDEEDYEKDID